MKRSVLLVAGLFFLALLICCPVQAFTAKSLAITVQDTTDAVITFDYQLSWIEHAAVFVRIGDPGTELKKALETNFNTPVQVTGADAGRSQFYVKGFAGKTVKDTTVTLTTPGIVLPGSPAGPEPLLVCPPHQPGFLAGHHPCLVPGRVYRRRSITRTRSPRSAILSE